MIKITTHTLNGLDGTHASNVKVILSQGNNKIFADKTDDGGRLEININISEYKSSDDFSLNFGIGAFFKSLTKPRTGVDLSFSSITFKMSDENGHYHIPVIISPNSCSLWWSGN